jgi:hypothetical protein
VCACNLTLCFGSVLISIIFFHCNNYSVCFLLEGSLYKSTSVDRNNYVQWNICGRSSNSRPTDLDTMLKDFFCQSDYKI